MSRTKTTSWTNQSALIEVPKKSYEVVKIVSQENNLNVTVSATESEQSILVKMYKNTNGRRSNSVQPYNRNNSLELNNTASAPTTAADCSIAEEQLDDSSLMNDKFNLSIFSSPSLNNWCTDSVNNME